jgi:hypothetical protein
MKRFFIFIFLLFIGYLSKAQQFGSNPVSIRWQQINTDTVRVIFPKGFDEKAQRIANIIHELQRKYSHSIGDASRKIDIVLHTQSLISNAYVGLAPFRSEFYLTPPQNVFELGAVNWADNLALHEFRHAQQFNNFNKGLSKVASVLFGEDGQALLNAAAIPDWFFEGDAVFNETRFTQQGRGAMPLFMSSYQTLFNANRQYSYLKMRNGSLRQYVPNHYALGYLLVAYGRKKYGDDIWRNVTDDAARFQPLFYPFQGAVKKHTGISYDRFVNDAMQYYQQQWQASANEKMDWLTATEKNTVSNYKYPYPGVNGSLIVLKTSYRAVPAFYKINPNGSEEKIAVRDIAIEDDHFGYNNGKIVYAAFQPDARWENRQFTTLKMLDAETGEEKKLVTRSKYFSPDISHDGNKIIAVKIDSSLKSVIDVMNLSGEIVTHIQSKEGIVFSNPKFSADDQYFFIAARNLQGEMALLKYSLTGTRAEETLLPFANRVIGFLNVKRDTVSFSMAYNGKNDLFAVIDNKDKSLYRLASYSTGLNQAALLANGKLASSAFTADGYRLASFQPAWEKTGNANELTDLYVGDVYRPADHFMLDNLSLKQYPVTKYKKSTGFLNIHSWRPFYEDPEYSFTLYGENVLGTLQTEIAYTYNQNEGSHRLGYNGIFGGAYLQPIWGVSQTWQRTAAFNKDTLVNWNELVGYAGLQLPLNLSGGKQYRFLSLSTTFNTERVKWTGIGQKLLQDRNVNYLSARLVYSTQIQKAIQHIYPHWAQSLLLQYRSSVGKYTAHQFLATGSVYLPGLATNHNLVLTAALHSRDTLLQYVFSNNFPFSRGYTAVDFPVMWRLGVNYHFPLAYPDWGLGGIVYFLRLRSNLFFDYTQGKSLRTGLVTPFRTIGTELFFDTKWWNQQPVSFGIRYSRLLDNEFRGITNPNVWELVLPVNLF